jgi:peptidoglycan hydrolase-like amidase
MQESRMVTRIYDGEGNLRTSPNGTVRAFTVFLEKKYTTIQVDSASVHRKLSRITIRVTLEANKTLEATITLEELHKAVKQGKKQNAHGYDGIGHNSFQLKWETTKYDLSIMKYTDGTIMYQQNSYQIAAMDE